MTTIRTVTLPDLGEGLTESDLVEWVVAVGDTVELNQVVAEVETAKALVQLPSPYAGVVAELLVEPGVTVPVGTALLTIAVEEPATADADADARTDGAESRRRQPSRRHRRRPRRPSGPPCSSGTGRWSRGRRDRGAGRGRRTGPRRTPSPTTSVSRSRAAGSGRRCCRRCASSRTTSGST